jgi:hypothetical protein
MNLFEPGMRGRVDQKSAGMDRRRVIIEGVQPEIDAGRFPGLFLVITGTPAFFDGPQGLQKLPPLAQRLQTDFETDARFDNPRATQIRLTAFDREALLEEGKRVRDVFVQGSKDPGAVTERGNDALLQTLADGVTGQLGGKVEEPVIDGPDLGPEHSSRDRPLGRTEPGHAERHSLII